MVVSEPIKGNELAKIIFFIAIQLICCFIFFWGVVPGLILLTGYLLSLKDRDVSLLKKAVTICNYYTLLTALIIIFIIGYIVLNDDFEYERGELVFIYTIPLVGCFLYYSAVKKLLVSSIENNFEKILCFGLVLPKKTNKGILNQDRNKNYSVSEELMKWAELKEKGIISDAEFIEMKDKILSKK